MNEEYKDEIQLGLPYDYKSVTHYSLRIGAINKSEPTMLLKTKISDKDKKIIGQRFYLTDLDVAKMNRKYSCKKDKYYLGDDLEGAEKWEDFKDKISHL